MTDIFFSIFCGGSVWFAKPDALKGNLIDTLRHVKPSVFFGVPRVWEKLADRIRLELGKSTGLKRRFSEWAMEIGLEGGYRVQNGSNTPFGWWLADFLFFSNVRQKLGLDQCKLQVR
jgi:long-chain-fatty-acid--CoA ligase ACSBG